MGKPPDYIFLQVEEHSVEGKIELTGVSWNENRINDSDIEYVRKSLHDDLYVKYQDAEIARIQAELKLTEITNLIQSFYPFKKVKP